MAQHKARASGRGEVEVLERGHVYFFYRPRVDKDTAKGPGDVQRLYLVLRPQDRKKYRLIIIPEKRLPSVSPTGDRKSWAFVQKVSSRPEEIDDELDLETYTTKTRGERRLPAARPAGEGVYIIVRHGNHTHFAYALELPPKRGDVQQALSIEREGSYIVSVKNPDAPSPPGVGLDPSRRARYPKMLRERFGDHRFIDVDPPELLDYEGAEILLIGASGDPYRELGLKIETEHESAAQAQIFRDLKLEKDMHPVTPLIEGKWE
jgi:hypothetical protein